jgi:hypothetical protein
MSDLEFRHYLANGDDVKESPFAQPFFRKQIFSPIAERAAKPLAARYREACFRPLDEATRHVPVEHLT